ncbi:hypothetical protein Nepgr_029988 [Nepenthes gracilis]|uniref:Uncharacterized protein n=1 Tax=Nepenthes gracilis TaxID=150966 RepID=A0AAD3TDR1_NEPGR|nr:hypothetical protein Nepgr_029988 [Nepenthes gracilis]
MYKATDRLLPIPLSIPGHSIKIPSSPKAVVKANCAIMPTSNSFEILSGEEDLSLLRKSATSVELPLEVEDLVGPKNPDAGGSRVKPVSPGHSHYNVTDEVILTNKVSIAPQRSRFVGDESVLPCGCTERFGDSVFRRER